MRASILSIGDELTLGQATDTNSRWLSARLLEHGVTTAEHRTVADDRPAIGAAIVEMARGCDLVLITGGLGPTDDDLTRHALGDVVDPGAELVCDEDALAALHGWFDGRATPMPQRNRVQAMRPPSMRMLPNDRGTAPGLAGSLCGTLLFALPGPPREMRPMFERSVADALPSPGAGDAILTELVHMYGLGESAAADRLGAMTARDRDPVVGTTAGAGIVSARVRTRGNATEGARRLAATLEAIEAAWAPYCFGRGATTLAGAALDALRRSGATLVTAESCTGGGLGAMIVDEPGASDVYRGGWVAYSNDLKTTCLGVPASLIERHGAVSEEVAEAMARGALFGGDADVALAVTGVAGPGGAARDKPVGTVFIALARRLDRVVLDVRRFQFRGERDVVRDRSAKSALQMLRLGLGGTPGPIPLIWQRLSRRARTVEDAP